VELHAEIPTSVSISWELKKKGQRKSPPPIFFLFRIKEIKHFFKRNKTFLKRSKTLLKGI